MITITVYGMPGPQGSKRFVGTRGGRGVMVESSAKVKPWREAVKHAAREHDDERHICPLQLEVIRRGIDLWTNPGDVVLSPFAGIGSELYVAVEMGRKAVGVELKSSYYQQAVRNLHAIGSQGTLF